MEITQRSAISAAVRPRSARSSRNAPRIHTVRADRVRRVEFCASGGVNSGTLPRREESYAEKTPLASPLWAGQTAMGWEIPAGTLTKMSCGRRSAADESVWSKYYRDTLNYFLAVEFSLELPIFCHPKIIFASYYELNVLAKGVNTCSVNRFQRDAASAQRVASYRQISNLRLRSLSKK